MPFFSSSQRIAQPLVPSLQYSASPYPNSYPAVGPAQLFVDRSSFPVPAPPQRVSRDPVHLSSLAVSKGRIYEKRSYAESLLHTRQPKLTQHSSSPPRPLRRLPDIRRLNTSHDIFHTRWVSKHLYYVFWWPALLHCHVTLDHESVNAMDR